MDGLRSTVAWICVSVLGGCEARPSTGGHDAQDQQAPAIAPSIPMTPQWSVTGDSAPFAVTMLGSNPAAYADSLMGVLPTSLFKGTTACAAKATPRPEVLIRVQLQEGSRQRIQTSPEDAFSACLAVHLSKTKLPKAPAADVVFEVTLTQSAPAPVPAQ